jgi:hypothetical protein
MSKYRLFGSQPLRFLGTEDFRIDCPAADGLFCRFQLDKRPAFLRYEFAGGLPIAALQVRERAGSGSGWLLLKKIVQLGLRLTGELVGLPNAGQQDAKTQQARHGRRCQGQFLKIP